MKSFKVTLVFSLIGLFVASLFFINTTGAAPQQDFRNLIKTRVEKPARASFTSWRTDEVMVRFEGEERARRIRIGYYDSVEKALERFNRRGDVVYAEPNYIAYALEVPNDPLYSFQWHMDNPTGSGVEAEEAWWSLGEKGIHKI